MVVSFPTCRRLIAALAVFGTVAPAGGQTDAAPLAVTFEYHAPPDCPDENAAFSLVQRRSQRVVRGGASTDRERLTMVVRAQGSRRVGVLTVTRQSGEREQRSFVGESCSEVVEALALTAALSIDPDATVTLGPARGSFEDETSSDKDTLGDHEPASDDDTLGDEASRTSAARAPIRVSSGPSISVQKLLDTTVHVGGGIAIELSRPDKRQLLPLELWLNANILVSPDDPAAPGVSTWFVLARLGYCPIRVGDDVALLLCPSTQLGAVSAESQGVEEASQATRFFATLGASGRLRVDLSRHVRIWLAPSLDFPLTKRQFGVAPGPEILVSTVDVSWDAAMGLSWVF